MTEQKRWWWLPGRLDELGLTRTEFAKRVGLPPSRITEMIRNTPVNGGKVRNFPADKLPEIANVLGINFISLFLYNIGNTETVRIVRGANGNVYAGYKITTPDSEPSIYKAELLDIVDVLDDAHCNQLLGFIKAQGWAEKNIEQRKAV